MSKNDKAIVVQTETWRSEISECVYELRGCPVMLDCDLAEIYEVDIRALKQAVRRSIERFPSTFVFEPTRDELESLISQTVISNVPEADARPSLVSQTVISKFVNNKGRGGSRYAPFAFTEHGVSMLASVLNSPRAIQVNITIINVFIELRKQSMGHQLDLMKRLESLESCFQQGFRSLERNVSELTQKFDRFIESSQAQKTVALQPKALKKIELILRAVAKHCGRQVDELKSPKRNRAISQARQIAIYFMRKHLGMTLTEIGQELGNRHHTTILYDCQKVYMDAEENETVRFIIGSVQNEMGSLVAL